MTSPSGTHWHGFKAACGVNLAGIGPSQPLAFDPRLIQVAEPLRVARGRLRGLVRDQGIQAGIRYLGRELGHDGLLSFLAVSPGEEAFQGPERSLRKEELMAFELSYSQDPCMFRYREDPR